MVVVKMEFSNRKEKLQAAIAFQWIELKQWLDVSPPL